MTSAGSKPIFELDAMPVPHRLARGARILFDGVFRGDYSLAIVNRYLSRALFGLGIDLSLYTPEDDWHTDPMLANMPDVKARILSDFPASNMFDVHLRNTWPPRADDMIGKLNGYVCFAWEESEFPQDLVDHFNRYLHFVLVTSRFVRTSLLHSGINIPVLVVGNGCDHIIEHDTAPAEIRQRAKFLHISSCFPRKGADLLVTAFAEQFRGRADVELLIKTFNNPHNSIEASVRAVAARMPDAPPITVVTKSMTYPEIVQMMKSASALVQPSRGEGFGLPMAEAMMLDVPIVTTGHGGQSDFCRPDTAWLVDYQLTKADTHLSAPGSLWAEPSLTSLADQLAAIMGNPREAKVRSMNAKALLKRDFTWSKVAERVVTALSAVHSGQNPGLPASTSIDLVSTWRQKCGIATYSEHLYSTPIFREKIRNVYSRVINNDELDEAATELPMQPNVTRVWGYNVAGVHRLIDRIQQGGSDVFWLQHHPGQFSGSDMALLGSALRGSGYRRQAITLHNVREALPVASWIGNFDVVFVHNANDAKLLSAEGVTNPVVIPHGILESSRNRVREGGDKFTVGTFGFLYPHKNTLCLLEGAALARSMGLDIELRLLNCVRKDGSSMEERVRVETLINLLELNDCVQANFSFIDDDDIWNKLSECDLLCFLYGDSLESASGAARVALAAGPPLLCSKSSVLSDLHRCSHVINDTSPEGIAEALLLLAADRDLLGLYQREQKQFAGWNSYQRLASRYSVHLTV